MTVKRILLALLVIAVLTIPDVLIELLLEVIDFAMELLHVAFEGFELLLEEIIQHVFHVDKVESQLYVFYILIGLGGWLGFKALKNTPAFCRFIKRTCLNHFQQQKESLLESWDELPTLQKVLLVTVYLPLALYFASFFVM